MTRKVRIAQLCVFVATMTLQVRVHAAEATPEAASAPEAGTILSLPKDTALTEIPDHCLKEAERCAVKTSARGKYKFPVGRAQVVMSNNTSVAKSTAEGVTFMSGAIWVQTPGTFTVETEFGEIHTGSDAKSEFWVVHRDGKVWAQAIENVVYLRPRGGQSDIKLEAGEEIWMGGVQSNGLAATGFAQPIYFPDFARQWALVYPDNRQSFKEHLDQLEVRFKEAAANVASGQQEQAQRQIASARAAETAAQSETAKKEKAKAAFVDRDKKFRDLFREKVLGD